MILMLLIFFFFFFFFKQKTGYEIPKRDWSSDVCSSDLPAPLCGGDCGFPRRHPDAPGRRLDAADARAAPPAVRDQYLVRLGRESPARPECGDGDARPG